MEANGVPSSLFLEVFNEAVRQIKQMHERAAMGDLTHEDENYMKCFTDVSTGLQGKLTSVPSRHLDQARLQPECVCS